MDKETNDFLSIGLTRYKEAHNIYWHFIDEVQKMLNCILQNRNEFGKFEVNNKSYVTKKWAKDLVLNSSVEISYNEQIYFIGIGLDWKNNQANQPIPFTWIEDSEKSYVELDHSYNWKYNLYYKNQYLGYSDNYKLEELEDVFENLLDELLDYFSQKIINNSKTGVFV